ncbi:MAG: hypothetical protein WCO96_07990 [Actinomycetes bacterium]
MTNHRRSTLIACAVAAAAISAAPATAAPNVSGTLAIKAPTCSKTAKASVALTAKPSAGSTVVWILVARQYPPTSPGDLILNKVYLGPASASAAALPEAGVTRRETVKVPVSTQLEFVAMFADGTTSIEKKRKFKTAKCPKPKKPAYTG